MINGVITVPNNLNTFIVNVSLSNNGGEYLPTPSFKFGEQVFVFLIYRFSLFRFS